MTENCLVFCRVLFFPEGRVVANGQGDRGSIPIDSKNDIR